MIHVPDRDLDGDEADGDGAAPVRKKTRRGSRGGKNRRKKPVGAAVATAEPETEPRTPSEARGQRRGRWSPRSRYAPEPAAPEDAEPADENGDEDWGYTPMSQWGLDE